MNGTLMLIEICALVNSDNGRARHKMAENSNDSQQMFDILYKVIKIVDLKINLSKTKIGMDLLIYYCRI